MILNSRLINLLIVLLFSLFHLYVSQNKFLIGGDSILPFDQNFNFHWKGFWNSSISNGSFLFTFYRPLEIIYSFFYFFTDNQIYVSNLVICFFKFISGYFLLILLSDISKNKILVLLFIFYYLYSPIFFNLDILPIFYYNIPILSCFIYFSLIKNQIKFLSVFSYLVYFYLSLNELPQPKYFILGNLLIFYFLFYNYFTFKKKSFLFQKKFLFLILNVIILNLVILFLLYMSFIQNYHTSNLNEISSPNILPKYLRYDQYLNNLVHGLRFFHNNTVLENANLFTNNFIFQIFYFIPFIFSLFFLKNIKNNKVLSYFLPPIFFFTILFLASNFPVFTIRDIILMKFTFLSFLRTSSGLNAYIFILFFYIFFFHIR